MKLTEGKKGKDYIIKDERVYQELLRLGLWNGKHIKILIKIPFGGPIIIQLNRQAIAIGKKLAEKIIIVEK